MNVESSLAEFPELQRLVDLRDAGWQFFPHTRDGQLVQIDGVRTWPGGHADAIRVRYTTDAAALRTDPFGGVVWQLDGTLVEVVDGLLGLPAPDAPGAPRLVKATTSWLWTPR